MRSHGKWSRVRPAGAWSGHVGRRPQMAGGDACAGEGASVGGCGQRHRPLAMSSWARAGVYSVLLRAATGRLQEPQMRTPAVSGCAVPAWSMTLIARPSRHAATRCRLNSYPTGVSAKAILAVTDHPPTSVTAFAAPSVGGVARPVTEASGIVECHSRVSRAPGLLGPAPPAAKILCAPVVGGVATGMPIAFWLHCRASLPVLVRVFASLDVRACDQARDDLHGGRVELAQP